MKSFIIAFAAVLATTSSAWATPAQPTLTHSQLVEIVRRAEGDPHTVRGFVGANLVLDLRPIAAQPFFAFAGDQHGIAFICQTDFEEGFAGGPVAATLVSYELGEDGRDFVKLGGCTAMER